MNIKDKLEVFSQMVMSEAEEKNQERLAEIKQKYSDACNEAQKAAQLRAEEAVAKEINRAQQARNKAFIMASTDAKKSLVNLRNRLMDELFANVEAKTKDFISSPAYEEYLVEGVTHYSRQYGDIDVQLMEKDMKYARQIKEIIHRDVLTAEEDFLGGYRVFIRGKNALLDETFRSKLQDERKNFNLFKIIG